MKAIKNIFQFCGLGVGAILFSHSISTFAATATVLVGSGGLKFVPAVTNISVGDSVIWNWAASGHSTTSGTVSGGAETASGLWNSTTYNGTLPHTFTNTFNSAGSFPYYCVPHGPSGMVGTINVAAANLPPTVAITNPANGIVLSAPASLTLKANATDADGSVTNVKFLQGTTLLGNVATAPFSFTVNNLAAASYTFSALASDNGGATATNSILVHVINPSPVNISALAIPSPNHFQFSYASDIGLSYVVQISTNLLSGWISIATNSPASANPTIFTDPNANNAGSFYRVGRLPNPQ
jgi:plastocyanin